MPGLSTNCSLSKVLLETVMWRLPLKSVPMQQHMSKMTWRSGSCIVQLPLSISECVYQVKNSIIVSFKAIWVLVYFLWKTIVPTCKSGRHGKNTSRIHGDVLCEPQALLWCLRSSRGNNSDVDYKIYKYMFWVLQSNLIIVFAFLIWSS